MKFHVWQSKVNLGSKSDNLSTMRLHEKLDIVIKRSVQSLTLIYTRRKKKEQSIIFEFVMDLGCLYIHKLKETFSV